MLSSRQAAGSLTVAVLLLTAVPWDSAQATEVGSFVDDDRSRFEPYIETARTEGLVSGCNPLPTTGSARIG